LTERLRIGIAGAGNIARAHIGAFKKLSEACEIVALCDTDERRVALLAEEHGIRGRYIEFEAMLLSETLDCIIVCTPTYLHCAQTIAALKFGISVLCEKPMAMDMEECLAMKSAAEDAGRILYIGFNHRFYGKFLTVKELLSTGDFGSITSMVAAIGHGGWKAHYGTWFTDKKLSGGGAFITCGIHLLDMLNWYGFRIESVFATMQRHFLDGNCEDDGMALLKFENGGIGSLHASYAWQHHYAQNMRLNFENTMVDIRDSEIVISRTGQSKPECVAFAETDSFYLQASAFVDAVLGKRAVFVSADDGIASLNIVVAAYQSHKASKWQPVPGRQGDAASSIQSLTQHS